MPIKIPLLLNYIDKAGRDSKKNMDIFMSDPVPDKARRNEIIYRCQFSMKIPDHIYDFLAGQTVPSNRHYGGDVSPNKYGISPKDGFPKSLSWHILSELITRWEQLLDDYRWLRDIDRVGLDKVIYYEFKTGASQYEDDWSRKKRDGGVSNIQFAFCIGYRIPPIHKGGRDNRYDDQKVLIPISEQRYQRMKFVKWTPDREAFFRKIQSDFGQVIAQINLFEANLSERKIGKLMANQTKLLGAGK